MGARCQRALGIEKHSSVLYAKLSRRRDAAVAQRTRIIRVQYLGLWRQRRQVQASADRWTVSLAKVRPLTESPCGLRCRSHRLYSDHRWRFSIPCSIRSQFEFFRCNSGLPQRDKGHENSPPLRARYFLVYVFVGEESKVRFKQNLVFVSNTKKERRWYNDVQKGQKDNDDQTNT